MLTLYSLISNTNYSTVVDEQKDVNDIILIVH